MLGHETRFGTFSEDSVDYPEFVGPAAEAVAKTMRYRSCFWRSGNGEAMAANKVKEYGVLFV